MSVISWKTKALREHDRMLRQRDVLDNQILGIEMAIQICVETMATFQDDAPDQTDQDEE